MLTKKRIIQNEEGNVISQRCIRWHKFLHHAVHIAVIFSLDGLYKYAAVVPNMELISEFSKSGFGWVVKQCYCDNNDRQTSDQPLIKRIAFFSEPGCHQRSAERDQWSEVATLERVPAWAQNDLQRYEDQRSNTRSQQKPVALTKTTPGLIQKCREDQ